MGDRREVTDKMWIKILGSLNVPDTALPEDYDMLQQELEVSKKAFTREGNWKSTCANTI